MVQDKDMATGSPRGDVLVLSKWHAGAVTPLADRLRQRGWRTVLLTAEQEDRNAGACDVVVRVDWEESSVESVAASLAEAGVRPSAVVNLMDVLMGWQVRLARHFGVPGPAPEYADLVDKAAVRDMLSERGLSKLGHLACRAGDRPDRTSYPAVVKPAQQSGGSAFVTVVHDDAELAAAMADIAATYGDEATVLVEDHVAGAEFSVDVVVQGGDVVPVMVVEKLDMAAEQTRDGGLLVTPPESPDVTAAAEELVATITALVEGLGLRAGWLHVEARVADGRPEIIEINPRCGGGAYMLAVHRRIGIDPLEYQIDLYLPEGPPTVRVLEPLDPPRLGFAPLDTAEAGHVRLQFTRDDLLGLPGVLDAIVFAHFVSVGAERENIFAEALIGGDDLASLRATEELVRSSTPFSVDPPEGAAP